MRSTIKLRSSSATAPKTVKTIFPVGVLVSSCSENETKSMPASESFQRSEQMRHRASKPVELPAKDSVEAPAVRVGHEPIELRPLLLRARDPYIHILADDAPAAALTVLLKLKRLDAGILALIGCRYAGIECHFQHILPLSKSSRTENILPSYES